MSLSRHNDEMLDSMKTFADRMMREKQKAHDTAEHYKRQLQEKDKVWQQLLEEVSKNARLLANQRIAVNEGDHNLRRLQDKLKVSDAFQGTLQGKLVALEKLLTQMSAEQLSLKEALAARLSKYEAAVGDAGMAHAALRQQLSESLEELGSCKAALTETEKRQQATEEVASQRARASAAEKEHLLAAIEASKSELQCARAALDDQKRLLADEKAEQLSVSQKCQMEKGELEKQLRLQADALRDTSERAAELQALLEGLQQKMNAAGSALAGAESSLISKSEELERIKESCAFAVAAKEAEAEAQRQAAETFSASLKAAEDKVVGLENALADFKEETELKSMALSTNLKEQEKLYWVEKDRLKKLQDEFAEQYENLGRRHAKEVKYLQSQAGSQLQEIEQHKAEVAKKVEEVSGLRNEVAELRNEVAELEAAKITTAAFHGAQLDEAATASQMALLKERDAFALREREWFMEKAALEAVLQRSKEAATDAEKQHEKMIAQHQEALEKRTAEVEGVKLGLQKKDAAIAVIVTEKQAALEAQASEHEGAIRKLQEERDFATCSMAEENRSLAEYIEELEARLADALRQLAAKEESLDGMRGQARMRENRLAEMVKDLEGKEELLKCISSAAATAHKTPSKTKPRGMPPPAPVPLPRAQEENRRRIGGNKKRRAAAIDENVPTQEQGIETLRIHQQQQKRLAIKTAGAKSGRTIFSSMSAEPVQLNTKSAAIGLFGSDIANPY